MYSDLQWSTFQGRIQDFKLGGTHLKILRRAEGGATIFGVFRVKNHDFTPKNHIFSNFRGDVRPPPPPWIRPCVLSLMYWKLLLYSSPSIVYIQLKSTCDVNLLSKLSIIFNEWRVMNNVDGGGVIVLFIL